MVLAGWMIRLFASPTFASRLKILTLSISRRPASAPPLTPNVEDAAVAALEVARRGLVGRVGLEARVADPLDLGAVLEPAGDREGVLAVALDAQRQRLEALEEQERVERAERGADVAEPLDAQLEDEREVAEGLAVDDAVVRRIRVGELREAARRRPVEVAAVDDDAADRRAVAADPLRRRVDDDVGAVLDRLREQRGEGVVDEDRHALGVGHVGDRADVVDVEARVADGLEEHAPWCARRSPAPKLDGSRPSTNFTVMPSLGSV